MAVRGYCAMDLSATGSTRSSGREWEEAGKGSKLRRIERS